MPLHKKIMHHINRHKEHIIAHVNKHHKKYIFGAGVGFGIGVVKVMAILALFLGISMVTGKSQAANEKLEVYKFLDTFIEIDDMAHQKFNNINEKNDPRLAELNKKFLVVDYPYHYAKNLNEKYKAAEKLEEFLESGYNTLQSLGYITPDENKKFYEMITNFDSIK